MPRKLPVNGLAWAEDISVFDEGFIKSYNEENDEVILLKLMFNIPKNCMNFMIIYSFCLKEKKLKKLKNL